MTRYSVEFSPEAQAHVDAIHAWWTTNRPASQLLFHRELVAAIRQVRRAPNSARAYASRGVPEMRRLLLPRTRHHMYYSVDEVSAIVRIHAVWHTGRGNEPPLP